LCRIGVPKTKNRYDALSSRMAADQPMNEPKSARVLITNDDGVDSPGIHELARQVEAAGYTVMVVAPDHDASGTGASLGRISPDHPVAYARHSIDGVAGEVYGINGPPALCVVVGNLQAFGDAPDIVVSGINAGLNTGRTALHSGTIGAALAAQNFGLRGLAVSLGSGATWHWETAAALTVQLLPHVLAGPARSVLNLNVPAARSDDVLGIRWAGLGAFGAVRTAITDIKQDTLHFGFELTGDTVDDDSDSAVVQAGYAAITSLHGPAEVWGPFGQSGEDFDAEHRVHGATAGHELRASRSYLLEHD
jgi:5'-nucleotidase